MVWFLTIVIGKKISQMCPFSCNLYFLSWFCKIVFELKYSNFNSKNWNIIRWDYPKIIINYYLLFNKIIEQIKSLFIFSSQDYTADCLLFGHYLINSMNIVYPRCKIENKISNKMLWFLAQWCCIYALNFVTNYILDAIISDIF